MYKLLFLLLWVSACSGKTPPTAPTQALFGGDRQAQLYVPNNYDHQVKTPLLVVLHGYGVSGYIALALSKLLNLEKTENVLIIAPEGVKGNDGKRSWNIEGTCCNRHDTDDVAYISELVEEIASVYNVDTSRIYAYGHSNGGTMAYHLACQRPDMFAAIVSMAGPSGNTGCEPTQAISILHIHGVADDQVDYNGGHFSTGVAYDAAPEVLRKWATRNGCGDTWQEGDAVDIEISLAGKETSVSRNSTCPDGVDVELWSIEAGSHNPDFSDGYPIQVVQWLRTHSL